MKIKNIKYIFIAVVLMLIGFQNCSDVKVSERLSIAQVAPPTVALSKPTGSICAPQGSVFGAPVRIVIILDMSMSNIGSVNTSYPEYAGGAAHYYIDTNDGPTDLNGLRFDQIKNFISNCGGSANVKYSIFGFSNRAQFARGQSCLSPFESQVDALRTVDAFKQQQEGDKARQSGQGAYPFYLGNETNYGEAITCLSSKIQEDLTLLTSERPTYHTFFLTDGQPTEDVDKLVPVLKAQINNILLSTGGQASGLHFQGLYYTSTGAKNGPPQQISALSVLTELTKVTEGPTGAALNIQNLSDTQTQLCGKLQPTSRIDYGLKTIYAINITSIMEKNNLVSDSDADGVSDAEELVLGWDPINYRSSSVFDGLCYAAGKDKASCASQMSKLTCVNTGFNFGLSDCDRAFAQKYYGRQMTSPDIDKDMMPNLIEIIRKTSPTRLDAFENPTVDGVVNIEKVTLGMDVLSSLKLWPIDEKKLMNLVFDANVGTCSNGLNKIEYVIEQAPLAEVESYTDPSDDAAINFTHAKNENVVLVISIWQSSGGVPQPDRLYVQKWLVPIGAAAKSEETKFIGEL